jgi:hypothetical protein
MKTLPGKTLGNKGTQNVGKVISHRPKGGLPANSSERNRCL